MLQLTMGMLSVLWGTASLRGSASGGTEDSDRWN
jgi:hypothetical protein